MYRIFDQSDVLVTSSFGTNAVFLLHLISKIRPTQQVHFIDTTYMFEETMEYKRELTERFGLNLVEISPDPTQNKLTRDEQWWKEHPNMCCTINKVSPLEPIKAAHEVWISGLMSFQTPFRAKLNIFEKQGDIIKFHPLIDLPEGEFLYQMSLNQLPEHPLKAQGYGSVGCTHCTAKGEGREGRWKNSTKTECGLHPGFFVKKK